MPDNWFRSLARRSAFGVPILTICAWAMWGLRAALGVLAGSIWHLASFWCLGRLVGAWIKPGRPKQYTVGLILLKFPALYILAFIILSNHSVSPIAFGVGFSAVLLAAISTVNFRFQRAPSLR